MNNEETENNIQDDIINSYKEIVTNKKDLPSYADFVEYGISRDVIRRNFGGMEYLHEYVRDNYSDFLNENFSSVIDIFSSKRNAINSNKKRFIVTTAVADSEAHHGFLKAMENYCNRNNAQIVIMPCESVTNSFEKKTAIFDKAFNNEKYLFVQEDTPLNENISLCSIQVSAKQIKPITGLTRIGKREGSYVFASPKQFLEYIPSGNSRGKNYSIMTPGACTLPKYFTNQFVSKRLSYIAEHDHTIGAIIIELENDQLFHFRQIQADESGDFVDLGTLYKSDGKMEQVSSNIVFGDLHGVQTNPEILSSFIECFKGLNKIDNIFLHDVYDGHSISHHIKDIAEKNIRHMRNAGDLDRELYDTYKIIKSIENHLNPDAMNIVKSNHDEFLDRYLSEGRYVFDEHNHYLALKIAPALFENKDVLKTAFELVVDNIEMSKWNFLDRESSFKIKNVECASHGDLGLNGAKSSLNSQEKVYGDCVVGHSHSAAIQRGVFRVGTLSYLDLGFNRGPSSWTHTCCLIYNNGQRQLINVVNGKCTTKL